MYCQQQTVDRTFIARCVRYEVGCPGDIVRFPALATGFYTAYVVFFPSGPSQQEIAAVESHSPQYY